ncbi:alpha beta-hydrolase [Pisolithus microcarpus]|nr:alpha beta-hydrolase [Pisolithus microcarpus]
MTPYKQESQEISSEFKTTLDPSTCTRRGLCPAKPLESHSLYYEVHGSGPVKIVLIMGLSGTSGDWLLQVRHFGRLPQYSVLVFDNPSPRGPYTTSGMANDTIVLLDFLGWTADRELHVIGISMGGMIAQERISSLSLVVTKAGGIPVLQSMLFPSDWLAQKAEGDPQGRTNAEVQASFALIRPQPFLCALSQMAAALTHHISASIPKVLILTGDYGPHGRSNNMPEAEYQCWKGGGHAICVQWYKRANALFERVIEEGRAASEQAI